MGLVERAEKALGPRRSACSSSSTAGRPNKTRLGDRRQRSAFSSGLAVSVGRVAVGTSAPAPDLRRVRRHCHWAGAAVALVGSALRPASVQVGAGEVDMRTGRNVLADLEAIAAVPGLEEIAMALEKLDTRPRPRLNYLALALLVAGRWVWRRSTSSNRCCTPTTCRGPDATLSRPGRPGPSGVPHDLGSAPPLPGECRVGLRPAGTQCGDRLGARICDLARPPARCRATVGSPASHEHGVR